MSVRKKRWFARGVLAAIPLAILLGLRELPNHDKSNYWPIGHVHNMLEAIGMVAMYIAGIVGGLVVMWAGSWTLYALWQTANDQPYRSLRKW